MANDDVKDALEGQQVAQEAIQAAMEGDSLTAAEAIQAALEAILVEQITMDVSLAAQSAALVLGRRPSGLPADAVPIHGFNSVDITEAVAVEIIAAPASGLSLFISKLIINNKTVAEDPVITVQDGAGTPVEIAAVMVSTVGGNGGNAVFNFDPPVELTTEDALNGIASGSLGDTKVHASGWVGTSTP